MNARTAARLAWLTWALSLVFTALGLWLLALTYTTPVGPRWGPRGFPAAFAVAFSTVGALIASRRPHNLIGWIFCSVGLLAGVQVFTEEYAVYAVLARPGTLPAGEMIAWIQNWIWVPGAGPALTYLLLLFPQGRLPSPRWRPVAWLATVGMAAMAFSQAFTPGRLGNFYYVTNPFGIEGAEAVLQFMYYAATVIVLASVFASAASLLLRFRRSTGEERQQLKWFAFAAALLVLGGLGGFLGPLLSPETQLGPLLLITTMLGIPIATGIAILRHRLYDIDIIIRRTLVYSGLSGALAVVYFTSVVLLQAAFRALTGQQQSEFVTVLSTLVIAALFLPLRRRVQDVIDRRFYRKKYDAAKTLAAFAAAVRDETDLDKLTASLIAVVQETMQPVHVSLWLKPTAGGGKRADEQVLRERRQSNL